MKKLLILFLSLIVLIILAVYSVFFYISNKSSQSLTYFPNLIYQSFRTNLDTDHLDLIILGLDRRHDWLEKTETTDTIILSQINFSQSKLHLFSLPRDLWDYSLNSKINQIYPESKKSSDQFAYIQSHYASISALPLTKTLILSTDDLKKLADLFGGIDLYLEKGFIDTKYPNDDYIQDPKSGAPIYKTVEFPSGWNHLDSSNITEFVRSRKSAETAAEGGTDLGRINRQQQLINALIDKLRQELPKNPSLLFSLYNFWHTLEHNISDADIFPFILKYGKNLMNFTIVKHEISTGEDPKLNLLYHPKKFINSQWVFIPKEKDYSSLKQFITDSLQP